MAQVPRLHLCPYLVRELLDAVIDQMRIPSGKVEQLSAEAAVEYDITMCHVLMARNSIDKSRIIQDRVKRTDPGAETATTDED